ncbi:MAG: hypothetical protein OEY18_04060 [Candidatus Aminicenantes bacterium]|nr:hypothetical protein [Candidatus Aminicenantes bacterium]MDH5383863.1 hypothetical protein [Candidatus Aminicenantes bacterium]MDH5743329.1 hypothetical protein [Candidatus Aminicenantes bacterium]
MAKNLGCVKLLLWIGIVLFFLWFLTFSLAPESLLASLSLMETQGFFLRLYGIFPLGWAVLFLLALKDPEKNIAIINAAIITAAFVIISIVLFHFIESTTGWFHWLSAVVLLVYNAALFVCKPKAA